jgi:hypothetical protein
VLDQEEFKSDEARFLTAQHRMNLAQSDPIYGSLGPPEHDTSGMSAEAKFEYGQRKLKPYRFEYSD